MSSVISPTGSTSSPPSTAPTASSGSTAGSSASAGSTITSTGIGSGLDITGIVASLTSAFGAAQTTQLTNQQNTLDAQVSAYGTFTSALDALQLSLGALETPSTLAGFDGTVADKTIASATTTSDAVAGSYTLEVDNLATAAKLTSAPVVGANTAVGTGALKIQVGGSSTSINIDSTDNTLSGIAAAINSASNNPGVTASVITASDGSRLVLSGTTTGAGNTITVTQSGGDGGLSSLVYDPANGITKLTDTQDAQDASFKINGFKSTSASNVVGSAITGVTINLLAPTATGVTTTLNVTPDTSGAQKSIDSFVTALNGVLSSIQTLTGYDPSTNTAGPLNGNATLQAFQNQLQNILGKVVQTGAGGVSNLTDLGITANADGSYSVDDTKVGNALSSNLTSVGNLLGGTNGLMTQLDSLISGYTKPGGLLATINTGLQTSLSNVSNQQDALAAQLATYSATLTAEYNAMDAAVAQLKQTQTFLNAEFNPSANAASGTSTTNTSLGSGNLSV
jgi:flagellar hook-associated protein 2